MHASRVGSLVSRAARSSAIVAIAAGSLCASRTAHAGGFEIPDNGAQAVGRGAAFVANMGPLLEQHRDRLKPEVITNAEFGFGLRAADIAGAELAHGEIVRRMAQFFERHEVLICPTAMTPAIPVEQRYLQSLNGVAFEGYLGWLVSTCAVSVTGCPVLALPCGFTADGLPVGLQVIAAAKNEARLLQIGAWLEMVLAVTPATPIDPRG